MVARRCPNAGCAPGRFQLGDAHRDGELVEDERMRRVPGTPGCTCPYCGHDDDDGEFLAQEDIDAAVEQVTWALSEDVKDWLEDLATNFGKEFAAGPLGIEMTAPNRRKQKPAPWREDLLRAMACQVCGRSYGVYAIGFFCPDCGVVTLANHFMREVALIVAQLDLAESVEQDGARELSYRLLGNAHEDVVTAFETYSKSIFRYIGPRRQLGKLKRKLRGNPFQNLGRAEELYRALDVELFAPLDEQEVERLRLNVEKRHLVGHNLGLADEKYNGVAQDAKTGETVSLLAGEIEDFGRMCLAVISHLERAIPEFN